MNEELSLKKEKSVEKFYPDKEDKDEFIKIVYKKGLSRNQVLIKMVKDYNKKNKHILCKKKEEQKK